MIDDERMVKVVIELPEPDNGIGAERVWAVPVGNDEYEVRNTPWHSLEVNWGDIVRAVAREPDQWPIVEAVIRRSGNRTIHVCFDDAANDSVQKHLLRLNALGAHYENADDRMYSVDLEPHVAAEPVVSYLEKAEQRGELTFRLGYSL